MAFAATSLLNYGYVLIASRLLTPADFGLLAFAQAILLLAGVILQSGIAWALTKFLAGHPGEPRGSIVRGAAVANLALALVLDAAIAALFVTGLLSGSLEQWSVVLLIAVSLPLFAVTATARATAQGLAAFGVLAGIQVLEVVGKVIAGIALMVVGLGAVGAIGGFAVGAAASTLAGVLVVGIRFKVQILGKVEFPRLKSVGPMFGAVLGLSLLLSLDLIAVKLLVRDGAIAGKYQAAIVIANAPYFFVAAAIVPVLFTAASKLGNLGAVTPLVIRALAFSAVLAVPIELILVADPAEALNALFPSSYDSAAGLLSLLAVGNIAMIAVAVFATAFQAVGRADVPAKIVFAIVIVEAAALVLLVPSFGAYGAASLFLAAAATAAALLAIAFTRMRRQTYSRVL